jgi:hypothetical protein
MTAPVGNATRSSQNTIPRSVWQLDDSGNAAHVESDWRCPANFGDYRRHDLHVYDAFGLDVSCDYLSFGTGDITLYLTKRTGADIKADFEGGKSAILKRVPDARLIPDLEQKTFSSERDWLHAIYSHRDGATLEGIWYAWYGDWEFEIRATYAAAKADAVLTMLSQMTQASRHTEAHLARCWRSQTPSRDGALISGDVGALTLALAVSATARTLPESAGKSASEESTLSAEWCVEGAVEDAADPTLLWHSLNGSGQTTQADRASLMTEGDPIVLESQANSDVNKIGAELKRQDLPIYVLSGIDGDNVDIYGFFSRRPNGPTLARLLSDIVHGRAGVLGSYNLKKKQITIVPAGKS